MAAFTVSGSSLPCLFLARVLILLAFHSTSAAFKDVEYTVLSNPSSYVSVIQYNKLGILDRVRRETIQNNSLSKDPEQTSVNTIVTTIPSTSKAPPTTTTTTTTAAPTTTTTAAPTTTTTATTTTTPLPTTTTTTTSTTTPTTTPSTTTPASTVFVPSSTTASTTTTNKVIFSSTTTTTKATTPITKIIEDNHVYYKSKIIQDAVDDHWVNLDDSVTAHQPLSDSHRMAAAVQMKFKFRFFGHNIVNVTVATGGFLYVGPFLHQWLTATQYIAPMMANFDTSLGNSSDIKIKDDGEKFVVQWHHVHLKDQNASTPFNFQVLLDKSGTIKFMYKELPILPHNISNEKHPVKIGLSDAYYIDSKSKEGVIRTIYEYHRVAIDMQKIRPKAVVILEPLPTCNLAEDCHSCVDQKINFNCSWCSTVQRCSDGVDWHRQDWFRNKCHKLTLDEMKKCPSYSAGASKAKKAVPVPVAVVMVIVAALILCISLGVWCFYGYSHPTTPLGIWMMEHRPSQMKAKMANMKFWKQSTPAGDKYRIESEA